MAFTLYAHPEKKVVLEEVALPSLSENQVHVKTAYSFLSAGTEMTMIQMGTVNASQAVKHEPLGYSMAGEVMRVGEKVVHVKVGDKVCCIGPGAYHASEVIVAKNLVARVPDSVSLREAAPAAMMCFALGGVRKAKLEFGENVVVLGGGAMGQLASQMVAASGCHVYLMDSNEKRLGKTVDRVTAVLSTDAGWQQIKDETLPIGVEVALFCFGGDGTDTYRKLLGVMCKAPNGVPEGRVSCSGGVTIAVPFGMEAGNIDFFSSAKAGPGYRDLAYEAGADYPIGYMKWTVNRNMQVVLESIAQKRLDITRLITHEYPIQDALSAYQNTAIPETNALVTLFKY